MDVNYRDFNGNSPHSAGYGAMFAGQPADYPPNGYAGYNPTYHYANPYLNASAAAAAAANGGYAGMSAVGAVGEYGSQAGAPFGMPPPQHHLVQDLNKLGKDR